MLDFTIVDEIIWRALKEDMPMGDITTDSTVDEDEVCSAKLVAKEDCVIAGIDVFSRVFTLLDQKHIWNAMSMMEKRLKGYVNNVYHRECQNYAEG